MLRVNPRNLLRQGMISGVPDSDVSTRDDGDAVVSPSREKLYLPLSTLPLSESFRVKNGIACTHPVLPTPRSLQFEAVHRSSPWNLATACKRNYLPLMRCDINSRVVIPYTGIMCNTYGNSKRPFAAKKSLAIPVREQYVAALSLLYLIRILLLRRETRSQTHKESEIYVSVYVTSLWPIP